MGADVVGGESGWYLHWERGRFFAALDLPDAHPYGTVHGRRRMHDLKTCDQDEAQIRFDIYTSKLKEER